MKVYDAAADENKELSEDEFARLLWIQQTYGLLLEAINRYAHRDELLAIHYTSRTEMRRANLLEKS